MQRPIEALVLVAFLLSPAGAAPDDQDHDEAWEARETGEILPLSEILERVQGEFDGKLLEVDLEKEDGRLVYEIELLTPQGNVIEATLDGRTGKLLGVEGRGIEAARKRR